MPILRRLIPIIYCASLAFPQTSPYPSALDTTTTLTDLADRAQTTLSASMTSSATSFTVISGSKFAAHMILTIDNEQIKIWSVVGNTVHVGDTALDNLDGRGYAGTSAASHASAALVSDYFVSWQFKAIRNSLIAIETTLGINLANIPTIPNPLPVNKGGTNAQTASAARTSLGVAALGANSDITSLSALSTPLSVAQGGTNAATAAAARSSLSAAASGANSDITSLASLSTPLSVAQGGTGAATMTGIPVGSGTTAFSPVAAASELQYLRRKPNNGSTIAYEFAASSVISASDYNFTAQTPGGSISVGSNTITLTPCPLGVAGTDAAHYLYLSAGTGTAEAVLMTGGTCTSGATTGTVIVTAANTHSSTWTISSATAGLAEAANSLVAGGGGKVTFAAGTFNFYGPFTVSTTTPLLIAGSGSGTIITVNQTTGTIFSFIGAGMSYGLRDFQLKTAGGTPRNITAVNVGTNGTFAATGLTMSGFHIYFDISGSTNNNYIADTLCSNPYTSAVGFSFSTAATNPGNTIIHGNVITGSAGGFLAGVYFAGTANTSGVWISDNDFFQASYGLYLAPGSGGSVGQVFSTSNAYQSTQLNGILAAPSGTGYVRAIMSIGDNIETGQGTGISLGGFGGTVDNVSISTCTIDLNASTGINLRSGTTNTTISNCTIAGNSQSASGTLAGILVDAAVSKFVITGNVLGPAEGNPTESNSQNYGIQISAGASDSYSITGNYIPTNATGTISDAGTGTHKVIAYNLGVDTLALTTVASATSITMPASDAPVIYVSGTTTVTTINGGWIGRRITLIKTDAGTCAVGGGGNVPVAVNLIAASNPSRTLTFDGTNWY